MQEIFALQGLFGIRVWSAMAALEPWFFLHTGEVQGSIPCASTRTVNKIGYFFQSTKRRALPRALGLRVVSRCGAKSFRLKFQEAKPQRWHQARPGRKSSSPSRKPHRRSQVCPPSGHANGSYQPPKSVFQRSMPSDLIGEPAPDLIRGVETGSRQENASNQESGAPFRFYRNGKGSGGCLCWLSHRQRLKVQIHPNNRGHGWRFHKSGSEMESGARRSL